MDNDQKKADLIVLRHLKYFYQVISEGGKMRDVDKLYYRLEIESAFPEGLEIARNVLLTKIEELKRKWGFYDEDIRPKRP